MLQKRSPWLSCDTELKSPQQIDYEQLEKLCEIKGLKAGKKSRSTEEAHELFMKNYKNIFQKKKVILPYIPLPPPKMVSSQTTEISATEDFHNISNYLKEIHGNSARELAQQFKNNLEELITILKKFNSEYLTPHVVYIMRMQLKKIEVWTCPMYRTRGERHFVYKMMITMPDLASQLTQEDFKSISQNITAETWSKGSTVVAHDGFYVILRGTVQPQCRTYKKMIHLEPSEFYSLTPSPCESVEKEDSFKEDAMADYEAIYPFLMSLGPCSGFGTLVELPEPDLDSNLYTLKMDEDCELLKINAKDYAKIKREQAKVEKMKREKLIHRCPNYKNWPRLSVSELTEHIKWKRFPPGHVLVTDGEIISFVAYIHSGFCKVYKDVIGLMKYQLKKMKKKRRDVFMGKLQENESFGEISVLLQIPFTCTIITGCDVELGIIDAEDILELDWVTQKLLVQTAEQTFGYLTEEEVQNEYITRRQHKEWKRFKNKTMQDSLDYKGVKPENRRWCHLWAKREIGDNSVF
ncbi:cyclic nucleotide-binding domain-containing protein 1 isoform X4 [Monodelphis domestica]|uniref:cyclic nucleotide-binding domain-containing protein 1 isoform X4 n=1 Tax=Monodelphis domestica TaxID=13616 RepID=UPI00044320E6|nr:cyclic nucleotide-binding domain-containing protein 1 isoform X4 [Monodelphis domestica]